MKKNNFAVFENATQGLLKQLDKMNLTQQQRLRAKNFVLLFRDGFKSDAVKKATFAQTLGDEYKVMPYDSFGFCKASSCSFVHLMDSPDWKLMYIDEIWTYGPHYFVMHMPSKSVFDLTFDQYAYSGIEIPYHMGRPIKINQEARHTMFRFMNAVGLDINQVANMLHSQGKD